MRSKPVRRDDWLIHQLPVGMVEDEVLVRFLRIFQDVADTVFGQVDGLENQFDVAVAPEDMVRQAGRWLGIDWIDPSLDPRLQREIVRRYAALLRWRGTERGLTELLTLLTDAPPVVEDSGGVYAEGEARNRPPHVHIEVQPTDWPTETDLVRILREEIPAACTFDLWIGGRQVWPRSDQEPGATADDEELAGVDG
jgi:phage tail-like protein